MRSYAFAVLFALLTAINAEDFNKYDAAAVKRFDDELRRLGVALPSLSKPEEPSTLPDPTVSSSAGDFEGYWTKSQFGRRIAAFEGIPYAQPPAGSLRFKLAQPLTSRLIDFKAKKPGSRCPQKEMFIPDSDIKGSEDCLFINVYAPETTERSKANLLPVMFYVHGGGYVVDKGDSYQCNILLDKDIVLVTFNYRLGTLGFLTTEDGVIPGNLGMKDQVLALKWVHENIAAFGGDPNLITVFGESAGGSSAEFLMLSPLTKGLIKRVIPMSGSVFAPWASAPPGETRQHVEIAAKHLNCPVEPSKDLLACLLKKTPAELVNVDSQFKVMGQGETIPFKPVVEGDIPGAHIPHHPSKLFADGPANDVPYMTGITSDEGLFFTVAMFMNDSILRDMDEHFLDYCPAVLLLTQPHEKSPEVIETLRRAYFSSGPLGRSNILEAATLFSDIYFMWPAVKSEQYHRKGSKTPGYFYYFNYKGSRSFVPFSGPTEKYGVSHADDFLYLFNYTNYEFPPPSPTDVLMSMIWTDMFTSFARDGVPSSSLLKSKWLPITTTGTDIEYLHVKSPQDITMKKDLLPERWSLLKTLLEPDRRRDEL